MLDNIQKQILAEVADLHSIPEGAYNIRANGQTAGRSSTANIEIVPKPDGTGIDIHIKPGTRHESVHIPVVLSESGLKETVYNDFYVGDAILVISHQERILNIADEIIVLAAGKVTQQGPRDQILPGLLGTTSAVTACTALEQGGREA